MPLTINVGLSRKAARHYQSAGLSLNLTAELDGALLSQPEQLQVRIAELYDQIEQALERQAARLENPAPAVAAPATPSQRRAITAICRRLELDPADAARQHLALDLAELSVRQASELIGRLERAEADCAGAGNSTTG